jgi:hypothetical protein
MLSRFPFGENVFEHDWDVLILLDTCRIDALNDVAPEYEFLSDIDSVWSVGSTSSEWIAQTFNNEYKDEIADTSYISANAWAKWVIEDQKTPEDDKGAPFSFSNWNVSSVDDFGSIDHVWKYTDKSEPGAEGDPPKPNIVTDWAINKCRRADYENVIIHYSQPHAPYLAPSINECRDAKEYERNPFTYLKRGGDFENVWDAYLENLRWVLDSLEVLLSNLEAEKVVISADHGEAFGEFGIYGHPAGVPHPKVKKVPWVIISGTDNNTHQPQEFELESSIKAEDQLSALGYL